MFNEFYSVNDMDFYTKVSLKCSKRVMLNYSTSFSLGTLCFPKEIRENICSIYGFVRLADEIVDTFHDYEKAELLSAFKKDTFKALKDGISLNPVLHSFQYTVRKYDIDKGCIRAFLKSMEMDLSKQLYSEGEYKEYIYGSAEVVGLMCLSVFCDDEVEYERLKPYAIRLGAAFQKINFLRDLRQDYHDLDRTYFPNVEISEWGIHSKKQIEEDIEADFHEARIGIKNLPKSARLGVYCAYVYYYALFKKIQKLDPEVVLHKRVRISNLKKARLFARSYFINYLNLI